MPQSKETSLLSILLEPLPQGRLHLLREPLHRLLDRMLAVPGDHRANAEFRHLAVGVTASVLFGQPEQLQRVEVPEGEGEREGGM